MVSFDDEVVSKVNRDNSGPESGCNGMIVSPHGLVVGHWKGWLWKRVVTMRIRFLGLENSESEMKNMCSKSQAAKPPAERHTLYRATESPAGRLGLGCLSNLDFFFFEMLSNLILTRDSSETTNLVNNEATSSGSSFINIDNSSTWTTLIIDKIEKFEELLTSGKATLIDEAGNLLKKGRLWHSKFLEQWRDSYGNGDYDEDLYDDDMYEGRDLTQELQAIYDNLDVRV
nr:hypothetical protein [Tanacetum cinerariifolium]GEY91295.1 hypothetical protein [Tanacetum cinerariifolium]